MTPAKEAQLEHKTAIQDAVRGSTPPVVARFSTLEGLPPGYSSVFGETFDSTGYWYQNFARAAIDRGDQVLIYGLEAGAPARAVGALPMRHKRSGVGLLEPRQLFSLSNYYTITFGETLDPLGAVSDEALRQLARTIRSDRWDIVELRPLRFDSPNFQRLLDAFRAVGMVVQPFFCFGNWYLKTEGMSHEAYFKTLPSAMQNTIKRKTKKLEKTGKARVEMVTGGASLEGAIQAYDRVYLSSWKAPEPYAEFVPGLIRACAENGSLRMGLVYLDNEPIAAQVWIVHAGKACIYKLAHDQKFDEFSAGSILTTQLMERVLDVDKVVEVDFGSGDDPYKKNWLPERRERWGILAMNPSTVKGWLSIARHVGGQKTKRLLQKLRPKAPNVEKQSTVETRD